MQRRARFDPLLEVRIIDKRVLRYDRPAMTGDDRPDHVRGASGLAFVGGRLVVVQDDASFIAVVSRDGVSSIPLARGPRGRRRFEVALGNKLDKLDLESCIAIGDELWAFGSGSLPIREQIVRVLQGVARASKPAAFYARLREEAGGALNLEGVALVGSELWLFHRGNTGPTDRGPCVLRVELADLRDWLDGRDHLPALTGVDPYDLGTIDGHRLGFTDAYGAGDRVFYLASAEASADAIEDGPIAGSQLGVITATEVRAASLGAIKAEGIALDPVRPGRAWIVTDPDDPEQPATLLEVELVGPW